MSTVLESIIVGVREDLEIRRKARPNLDSEIANARPITDAHKALGGAGISIIAEVKRSSPSKGELASITDPAKLAAEYEMAGASVVSVLTEERRFKGSIADFKKVREEISIPMLRKDFIVDEYQVFESRAIGADLQLLIVAALSKSELKDFFQIGSELGMASLFEVHSLQELEITMALSPKIVGVNSRNLKTLEVDPIAFDQIIPQIPKEVIKVAESGISKRSEVAHLETLGANAILVGETLVRASSAASAIADLLGK
jgi:indole-3-glycerol phosphate synthase